MAYIISTKNNPYKVQSIKKTVHY